MWNQNKARERIILMKLIKDDSICFDLNGTKKVEEKKETTRKKTRIK
jgi:hypothetical protein